MKTNKNYNQRAYERAQKRVKELRCFYQHLAIYVLFIPFFVWLNLHGSDFPWAIFPIVGWGLGVISHAAETFEWKILFGRDWEERKIKEFMDKDDIYL